MTMDLLKSLQFESDRRHGRDVTYLRPDELPKDKKNNDRNSPINQLVRIDLSLSKCETNKTLRNLFKGL